MTLKKISTFEKLTGVQVIEEPGEDKIRIDLEELNAIHTEISQNRKTLEALDTDSNELIHKSFPEVVDGDSEKTQNATFGSWIVVMKFRGRNFVCNDPSKMPGESGEAFRKYRHCTCHFGPEDPQAIQAEKEFVQITGYSAKGFDDYMERRLLEISE